MAMDEVLTIDSGDFDEDDQVAFYKLNTVSNPY